MLRLTVWTLSSLGPELQLTDVNGRVHTLQRSSIVMMIGAGWILHLGSFIFNGLYYKLHPSGTDISGGALKKRIVCNMENTLEQEALEMRQKNGMYCAWKKQKSFLAIYFIIFSCHPQG